MSSTKQWEEWMDDILDQDLPAKEREEKQRIKEAERIAAERKRKIEKLNNPFRYRLKKLYNFMFN